MEKKLFLPIKYRATILNALRTRQSVLYQLTENDNIISFDSNTDVFNNLKREKAACEKIELEILKMPE